MLAMLDAILQSWEACISRKITEKEHSFKPGLKVKLLQAPNEDLENNPMAAL